MKTMKKRLISLLFAAVISVQLISCSEKQAVNNMSDNVTEGQNNTEAEITETTAETTTTSRYMDNLPEDLFFDGMTMRFLLITSNENQVEYDTILVEETNGEIINDAIYNRNAMIYDRLGAKIEIAKVGVIDWGSDSRTTRPLRASVQAGSDDYEAVAGYQCVTIQTAAEGLLADLRTLDYLDFEKPYWSTNMIENMSYRNKSYWATGDIALNYIGGMYVSYVNKRIYDNLYKDNIYDIVYNGDWTIDKVQQMSEEAYIDLNGNGEVDIEEDQMGFILRSADDIDGMMIGSGVRFTKYNGEGVPEFSLPRSRMIDFHDKMYNLLFNTKGAVITKNYGDPAVAQLFADGKDLIHVNKLWHTQAALRYMQDDFFILPVPKLDSEQQQHYASTHDGVTIIGIPATASKQAEASAVLEAMAAESLKAVTPTYYEISIKTKFTRDNESAVMLDYIRENVVTDFANLYQRSVNCLLNIFSTYVYDEHFASTIESLEGTYVSAFDKLVESFETER